MQPALSDNILFHSFVVDVTDVDTQHCNRYQGAYLIVAMPLIINKQLKVNYFVLNFQGHSLWLG